jgi:hypothetical protein
MATRSLIGKENSDNTVTYIYCHWDGHIESVGKTLANHYDTADKLDALLQLGDLSTLGSELGEKHPFNKLKEDQKNWCESYSRDRGESNSSAYTIDKGRYIHDNMSGEEYKYIFTLDNKWVYFDAWDTSKTGEVATHLWLESLNNVTI